MLKENEIISKVLLTVEQYKGNLNVLKSAVVLSDYTKRKFFSRLLLWKVCLITETLNFQLWESKLSASRVIYHKLSNNSEMIVPWSKLDKDSEFYLPEARSRSPVKAFGKTKLTRVQNVSDPLSKFSTPYESNEPDTELLELIALDVMRLFPGEPLFHDGSEAALGAKRQLISILYVWAKCNPQVGYKQGLHEILGLLYMNLMAESVEISQTSTFSADDRSILQLYDLHYLPHDLFAIFNRFMIPVVANFYQNEAVLMKLIEDFNALLMKVDQLIHYNLVTKLRLESQLWIIRYLRLLLLRELGNDLEVPAQLWDKMIASESYAGLPTLLMFIIIVLLVHIKTELVLCDFSEALSLLLHYPTSNKMNMDRDFIDHLFSDAYKLMEHKNNDLKLYECGIKLNKKHNSRMRITVGYASDSSRSDSQSPAPVVPDSKAAKMAFEKYRMEMRLKKKAQLMLRN